MIQIVRPRQSGMLGVLGGMGPLATAWFYRRVVEATPSTSDQGHIPVVIWGDPTVPDRSAALLNSDAPSPGPWLTRGARALVAMGAELIAVPCNSAYPFVSALRPEVPVPMIDIVRATVDEARVRVGAGSRIVVLSTEGAHQAKIYSRRLAEAELELLEIGAPQRTQVHTAIADIKAGRLRAARDRIAEVVRHPSVACADTVIMGCTELTVLRDDLPQTSVVVDSAAALASRVVATLRAGG